jgi:triacylglycerol lipase
MSVAVATVLFVPLIATTPPPMTPAGARADRGLDLPGPAMLSPAADRADALSCSGDLDEARRPPVLLVPGTSLTPTENWNPTYRPVLLERGHAVCMVRLPAYATRDMQANIEYVATAIRMMADRSSRKISTIGDSQGALLPQAALRTWPDLAADVSDVIGVGGVYDRGSKALVGRCRTNCIPVLHQMATGSAFLAALRRRPLPHGPSYTNIGTRGDQTVTPQPSANQVPGATSIMVQDACPLHRVPEPQHTMILGDSVALALALDALDHDGPASSRRLSWGVCFRGSYPEFDLDDLLSRRADKQLAPQTRSEPRLYCRDQRGCQDAAQRGYLLSGPRVTVGRHRITVRARALQPGKVRVAVPGHAVVRRVRPGAFALKVPRSSGGGDVVVATRWGFYRAWAVEARRSVAR